MNSKKLNTKLDLAGDELSDALDQIEFNDENNSDEANIILESIISQFVDLVEIIESDEKLGEQP